jgi:hypothetical protein
MGLRNFSQGVSGAEEQQCEISAHRDPDDINVCGMIEFVVLASVKVEILEMLAALSRSSRKAIEAWVAWQIEHDPTTATVFQHCRLVVQDARTRSTTFADGLERITRVNPIVYGMRTTGRSMARLLCCLRTEA